LSTKLGQTGGDLLRVHDSAPRSWKWLTARLLLTTRVFLL